MPTDILLDSGAGITVLDQVMADKAGLKSTGALAAQGVGGTTSAGVVEGVTLQLGELTLGPLVAATLDLSPIEKRLGRSMPVILGKEVFHAMVVDIDYPNARIRFLEPAAFTGDGPGRRLEVLPGDDGHKLLKMSIEGLPEAIVSLDTGQGGALTLFRRYVDDNRLLEGRRTWLALSGGVGGNHETTTATLKNGDAGGLRTARRADLVPPHRCGRRLRHREAGRQPRRRHSGPVPRRVRLQPRLPVAGAGSTVRRAAAPRPPRPHRPARRRGAGRGVRGARQSGRGGGLAQGRAHHGAGRRADRRRLVAHLAWWSRAGDGTKVQLTTGDGTARAVALAAYY
ncbi:MAG: retropepsin-like domain-containing protein [bacterium]|nr:retropepsin-like domain-containing protein [bacterium]